MNKKINKSLALAGVLAIGIGVGAGVGTYATYRKTFRSNDNLVRSANFNVDVKGDNGMFTDKAFTLVGKDLKPGTSKNVYEFEITRDTEVDVQYEVLLKNEGELFKAGTPVNVSLERLVGTSWEKVDSSYKYKPSSNKGKDKFRIMINWAKDTAGVNDADFAGKEGKINITVNANQVVERKTAPKDN